MERLQEALSRARQQRKETLGSNAKPTIPALHPSQPAAPQKEAASPKAATPETARTGTPVLQEPAPEGPTKEEQVIAAWRALPQYTPNERLLTANRVVSFFGGRQASPFDMMRTKIIQQAKANNWRRIVITSPSPQCGKTTITANLAFTLARHTDLRIMVIEADMRRPELARLLGIKENLAFARALSGHEAPEQHLVAYGSNLAFATNQVPAANPSELLQSVKAQEVLAQIEETYQPDIVLFDAAPMLASDDTVGLLDFVDCALIVAAAETTSIEEVDVTESEIAAATNVLGVVLNKTRYSASSYGYEEGYY
jgi:capsular exopolysaccharide synthesis family protein